MKFNICVVVLSFSFRKIRKMKGAIFFIMALFTVLFMSEAQAISPDKEFDECIDKCEKPELVCLKFGNGGPNPLIQTMLACTWPCYQLLAKKTQDKGLSLKFTII